MIYLDTSAFLKLYILEPGSEEVHDGVRSQDHPLPVWDILKAEMTNALQLKVYWGELTQPQSDRLKQMFDDRLRRGLYFSPEVDRDELMTVFYNLSLKTPVTGCRTMDILHVACAVNLRAEIFYSFDRRQRSLAQVAGLKVRPE